MGKGHRSYYDPESKDCKHYYYCKDDIATHKKCPGTFEFHPLEGSCTWRWKVKCGTDKYPDPHRTAAAPRTTAMPTWKKNMIKRKEAAKKRRERLKKQYAKIYAGKTGRRRSYISRGRVVKKKPRKRVGAACSKQWGTAE